MDLKVAVVVFKALGNCAIHRETSAAKLGRRDGKPLAFDVKDFLLVLPTVKGRLIKVDDRSSVSNILG